MTSNDWVGGGNYVVNINIYGNPNFRFRYRTEHLLAIFQQNLKKFLTSLIKTTSVYFASHSSQIDITNFCM